ncbi:MAG TPA: TIGR03557 family F420-dependent LLM class oxidoreductase [Streptosporangiaceae bacterium]|nr:TIGR03557 family F420-dependent LLM class oxidoreductase [Streptosporangiaceae bacterium]
MKFAWLCSHESYQPEALVEQALAAEDAGFDAVLGSDHFHPWVDDTSAAGFVWSWLGTVAARTDRVQLGTCVTCPLFHYQPGLVAQMAATADRLSGGRMLLGLGTGEAINERSLGFSFPGYGERHARMEEALEIIRRLLQGEKLTYHGSYYTTETARLYSPPRHPVPMLMAAGGPKSATLAGQRADGIITSVKNPEDTISKVIAPYRRAADERAGSQMVLATRWTVLGQDNDEAWLALSSMRGLRAPGRLEVADPAELRARADAMDPAEVLGSYTIVRDAAELIGAYQPLVTDIGADMVSIQVASADPLAAIRLIGQEVLPKLRSLAPTKAS